MSLGNVILATSNRAGMRTGASWHGGRGNAEEQRPGHKLSIWLEVWPDNPPLLRFAL